MLDTVNLWLNQSNPELKICNQLDRMKEHISDTGEVSYSGCIDNYRVIINEYGILLQGSLAKYYLGDNFQTLTRKATQEALESLSDRLKVQLNSAEVKRLDIAQNFIMDHQHQAYYDSLGNCCHFKRLEQPKSIYYTNSTRQLIFYNKVAEGKHRRQQIPPVWHNKQVLRYELRFMKKPGYYLDESLLLADNLYSEGLYMKIVDHWYDYYFQINKIRHQAFAGEIMNDTKLFKKQLMFLGIKSLGGEQAIMDMIERSKAEGKFSNRMQATRLKQEINGIAQDDVLTVQSELIDELDQKVKQAVQFYR